MLDHILCSLWAAHNSDNWTTDCPNWWRLYVITFLCNIFIRFYFALGFEHNMKLYTLKCMTVEMFNLVRPTEQSNSSFFSYTVRILCSTILLLSIESHMLLLLLLFCRNVVLFYSSFEWIVISVVATNSKLLTEGKRGGCGFVSSYQLHEIIIPIILIMTYPCQ